MTSDLTAKQKTSIRRVLREKCTGKTFTQTEYRTMVQELASDNGVHVDIIDDFLNAYKKFPKGSVNSNATTYDTAKEIKESKSIVETNNKDNSQNDIVDTQTISETIITTKSGVTDIQTFNEVFSDTKTGITITKNIEKTLSVKKNNTEIKEIKEIKQPEINTKSLVYDASTGITCFPCNNVPTVKKSTATIASTTATTSAISAVTSNISNNSNNSNKPKIVNMFDMPSIGSVSATEYKFPIEPKYARIKRLGLENAPIGSTSINDQNQIDDIIDPTMKAMQLHVKKLRAIISPDQGTQEWLAMRRDKITASDGGAVVDVNKHEAPYKFLVKKLLPSTFSGNMYTHHGKKFEKIATSIYEFRLNVTVDEYGLLGHPKYKFLGASPDGIVGWYKKDEKHLTKYVGRMVEIKCPLTRKINMEGDIFDICPEYYWVQVQLQLECCELEECDFWQCSIYEYSGRDEFINDTDKNEPYRSKTSTFEKGCVIQLLPCSKIKETSEQKYLEQVYEFSKYVYPPKIDMTPYDYDRWIAEFVSTLNQNPKYKNYYVDRIIYWRLNKSNCTLIKRDKEWFATALPKLRKMWDYVEFFRANPDKCEILLNFINSMKMKYNKQIMKVAEELSDIPKTISVIDRDRYTKAVKKIIADTETNMLNNKKFTPDEVEEEDDNRFDNKIFAF